MALSGKDGKILIGATPVGEIRGWQFTKQSRNPTYASSASGGFKKSEAGVKFLTGSARYVLDLSSPLSFDVGDPVTLILHVDETNAWTVPARVETISVHVDVDDTGDVVGGTFEFKSNGAWTEPGA